MGWETGCGVPVRRCGAGTLLSVPISNRILDEDEEVLVDMRLHWVFLLGPLVATAAAVAVAVFLVVRFPSAPVAVAWVLAVMVAVPAAWAVGRIVRWLGISLVVTTARIVYRRGILGRQMTQLRLQRVTEIHSSQTVLDRIIGCGQIEIEIAGEEPMTIDDVRRPGALQRVINRQLDGIGATNAAESARPAGVPMRPLAVPGPMEIHDTPPHGVPIVFPTRSSSADRWSTADPSPHGVPPFDTFPPTTEPEFPDGPPPPPEPQSRGAVRASAGQPTGWSIPEQLIQLDDLRRRGIISDGEFAAKKTELLRRL